MYSVYILQSLKNSRRYVGYTRKAPNVRLSEHNRGCNKWSKNNSPFVLIYVEEFSALSEATTREKFLKSGKGREFILNIIRR